MTSIFFLIPLFYASLFIIEMINFFMPLQSHINGRLTAITFNTQKQTLFIIRILQTLMLPLVGLLFDATVSTKSILWIISLSMLSGMFGTTLIVVYLFLKNKLFKVSTIRFNKTFFLSCFYIFQFSGMPICVILATRVPEYQITILQCASLVNFISGAIQVVVIDRFVAKQIENRLAIEEYKKLFSDILLGRLMGKILTLPIIAVLLA